MRVITLGWFIALGMLADTSPSAGQGVSRDTAATPRPDSVRPALDSSSAAVPAPAPIDPAVRTACGSLEAPSLAPDLLLIVFAPEADGPTRAAVARSVHGKLVGRTGSGDPDSYYLRAPAEGNDYVLRAIADRLIGRPEVRQVGATVCPPAPAPRQR
jgi:hypothetical protein